MKSVLRWCVVPLLAGTLLAQTAAKPKTRKAKPAEPAVTAQDVQSLRDAIAAQQQQIEQLTAGSSTERSSLAAGAAAVATDPVRGCRGAAKGGCRREREQRAEGNGQQALVGYDRR